MMRDYYKNGKVGQRQEREQAGETLVNRENR